MEKNIGGLEVSNSAWNRKLRIATLIFAGITVLSSAITLFLSYTVPGLSPIGLGCTMALLGVREWNQYFKGDKQNTHLIMGVILLILFIVNLYLGIDQILAVITKAVVK